MKQILAQDKNQRSLIYKKECMRMFSYIFAFLLSNRKQ